MSPTLEDGDYVLTKKPRQHLVPGFLYVVNHTDLGRIVKRLSGAENGLYHFEGDNPASTPSTIMGRVQPDRITGQVILIIGKSGLRRP